MNTKKKVTGVLFLHENEVIENIKAEKLEAPKSLGFVTLNSKPKKIVPYEKNNKKAYHLCNFPISLWTMYLTTMNVANKKIGEVAITLSKKAYENKQLNENFGSVWYTCDFNLVKEHFERPIEIKVNEIGLRRITKSQIKKMGDETIFHIMWIDDDNNIDVYECIKNPVQKSDSLTYLVIGDKKIYNIEYSQIQDSGSGRVDAEDIIIYVSDKIENI